MGGGGKQRGVNDATIAQIDERIIRAFVRARADRGCEELWTDVLFMTNPPVWDIVQFGLLIANP